MRLDHIAAQTWDAERPLSETSAVIHDGAVTEEQLAARARHYVSKLLLGTFPQAIPPSGAVILEIGSGLGWIMQAMDDYLHAGGHTAHSIIGLDIAANMIAQAKQRRVWTAPFSFQHYDGMHVPFPDASLDLIYSVAALQHVPRPFVFNLFFEMRRLLKPRGHAVFHLLSTSYLSTQERFHSWRAEISNQINGSTAHWHHYYTKRELNDVLRVTGFNYVEIAEQDNALLCCVGS